jgi:hypothetical protein
MDFAVGSLVQARGREWVVLPKRPKTTHLCAPWAYGDEVPEFTAIRGRAELASTSRPDTARRLSLFKMCVRRCASASPLIRWAFRSFANWG